MRRIFWRTALVLLLCLNVLPMRAHTVATKQTNDDPAQGEVVAVIKQLFDGMKTNDSAKVRATLDASARLQTTGEKAGKPFLRTDAIDGFVKMVGEPKNVAYDERIQSYDVRIDDRLATVWTPYEFYVGDKFSHCGVNAFQLYKSEQGWKIIQITDTRRKDKCVK